MTSRREKTAADKLAEMLEGLEHSRTFQVEGLKHEISESIFQAMERNDVSRAALAEQLGTSRAYVTKVLQGATNFTLESLVKIAGALNCNVSVQITPRKMEKRWEGHRRAVAPTSRRAPMKTKNGVGYSG